MSLGRVRRQQSRQLELPLEGKGAARPLQRRGETPTAANGNARSGIDHLMERVVEGGNVKAALTRVQHNKGSPGVEGMTVAERPTYLAEPGEAIRAPRLDGTYQPKPVRRQEIPKRGGGVRELGIPCVLDRLIQQAILQVRHPMFDPTFSEHRHGFRPGRHAHAAVCEAQRYMQEGTRVVVDVDLEKFFDRVGHDVRMGRLEKRIGDKRMLGRIRRDREVGIMTNGVVMERHEGTPQGGPLSPLMANVLLDEVDKELEQRGIAFVRYADDLNASVGSTRAGADVRETLTRLYARLRLRINEAKRAVARPEGRKFLGYSFWNQGETIRRRVAPQALGAMKDRVRYMTSRTGGRSHTSVAQELRGDLVGWRAYDRLAETPSVFRDIDTWIRHRLRMGQRTQWKRGTTVYRALRARGVPELIAQGAAAHAKRWWRTSTHSALNIALPNSYFDRLGVPRLAAP